MNKDVLIWLLPLLILAVLIGLKLAGQISETEARRLLAEGAVVIDVRGAGEFASGHLTRAINLPVDSLARTIASAVPDKNTPLLVHCLSGTRSALAVRSLRAAGYTNVHNLGSLSRARAIVEGG